MPSTIVKCPRCNAQYKLSKPSLDGKKIKCRKCQSPFQVSMAKDEPEDELDDFTDNDAEPSDDEFDDDSPSSPPSRASRQPRPLGKPLGARKVKKKKKVEEDDDEDSGSKSNANSDDASHKKWMIAMIGVAVVVAVGGIGFVGMKLIGGGGGAAIEVPQNFVRYKEVTCALMFEYPEGWQASHGGGVSGIPPWAKIEKGDITIVARDSLEGSIMGGGGFQQDGELPDELDPVHAVHLARLQKILLEEPNYKEEPPEVFNTAMGEARIAAFKKPQMFGAKYGYRATLPPNSKRQFNVTCQCSKAEFEALKDTFRKIISSMNHGSG